MKYQPSSFIEPIGPPIPLSELSSTCIASGALGRLYPSVAVLSNILEIDALAQASEDQGLTLAAAGLRHLSEAVKEELEHDPSAAIRLMREEGGPADVLVSVARYAGIPVEYVPAVKQEQEIPITAHRIRVAHMLSRMFRVHRAV